MNETTATPAADVLERFKANQREAWVSFEPLATFTTPPAARLVRFAGVRPGQRVLDVGCGTGVVAITAARHAGARVTGADLTPELIEAARRSARIAGVEVDWHVADVEQLPFEDRGFDVVLSQFGHMFAPRPAVAVAEMLRVLEPGGTIAFSTWPSELGMGRMFGLMSRYLPPPPPGVAPPVQWGDVGVVRERLGAAVRDLSFDRDTMLFPALSVQHHRWNTEQCSGNVRRVVEALEKSDPDRLAEFRREYDALMSEYFENNQIRQSFLMTRAIKS